MAVFFSFHYDRDAWRVQQILNMGALEGQTILNAQEWEAVKSKGVRRSKKLDKRSDAIQVVGRSADRSTNCQSPMGVV